MTLPFPEADPARTLLAVDFDGTLSPIVLDPESAFALPEAIQALTRLAEVLGQVAIVTGRPVAQVRQLARFEQGEAPRGLFVCGQYGAELWDSATDELTEPAPRPELRELVERLPSLLAAWGAGEARVEDKRMAVAVHTRGLDPEVTERIVGPLDEIARDLGLEIEPGREVLELRPPGTDKGQALAALIERSNAKAVVWAGDDLGDLPAFAQLEVAAADGIETLGIAITASESAPALLAAADATLEGPESFAAWLNGWAEHLNV